MLGLPSAAAPLLLLLCASIAGHAGSQSSAGGALLRGHASSHADAHPLHWGGPAEHAQASSSGSTPGANGTAGISGDSSSSSSSSRHMLWVDPANMDENTKKYGFYHRFLSEPVNNPKPRRPYIYVYNPNYHYMELAWDWFNHQHGFYSLDFLFPAMLHKSPYVTTDPEQADYFVFPTYLYFGKNRNMEEMLTAMRRLGPWLDRKNGSDHIFVITDDFGACPYAHQLPEKAIVVHHWGKVYQAGEPIPCDLFDKHFGGDCDVHLRMADDVAKGEELKPPCHKPFQYIVVPPGTIFEARPPDPVEFATTQFSKYNRSTLMFYAGPMVEPINEAYYSLGVRQTVYRLYKRHPGFKFYLRHIPNYAEEIQNSIFCLAAAGWGWGGRVKASVLNGCIPLIMQDGVKVEWEEQLPMHEYAVRLPFYMAHKMPEVLHRFVEAGRTKSMLDAMRCTWRFHYWYYPVGRAFDLLMCELKARALGKRLSLDLATCKLDCGDGQPIDVANSQPYMV